MMFSPLVTDGLSHPYHLGEPTSISIGASEVIFQLYFIFFFDEIRVSKQSSPRWEAAFCICPIKGTSCLYG